MLINYVKTQIEYLMSREGAKQVAKTISKGMLKGVVLLAIYVIAWFVYFFAVSYSTFIVSMFIFSLMGFAAFLYGIWEIVQIVYNYINNKQEANA